MNDTYTTTGSLELFKEALAADAERQRTRMICAACGEIVYDGPLREGRNKMTKHREQFHPELAVEAVAQKRARSKIGVRIGPLVGDNTKIADKYARELAAARRDARLAARTSAPKAAA